MLNSTLWIIARFIQTVIVIGVLSWAYRIGGVMFLFCTLAGLFMLILLEGFCGALEDESELDDEGQ